MASRRVSKKRIRAAIPGSGGIIAQIARNTGYAWNTVDACIKADQELAQMRSDEEAVVDDLAEAAVIMSIKAGNTQDAKWWLAHRRKTKFGDSLDLTSGGKTIELILRGNIAPNDV